MTVAEALFSYTPCVKVDITTIYTVYLLDMIQELIRRWDSEREPFLRRHRTFTGRRLRPL